MVVVLTLMFAAEEPGRAGADPPTEVPGEQQVTDTRPSCSGEAGYAEVSQGRLYYEVAGQGRALVLLHDGLLHCEVWDEQVPAFSRQYTVIRYDRRGYGHSPAPADDYSNVDDLLALLRSLHVERAILVGASGGGEVALNFAVAHPDMVDALVLSGGVVDSLGYSSHFLRRVIANFGSDTASAIEKWINDKYEIAPQSARARERMRALLTANPQNLGPEKDQREKPATNRGLERLADIRVPTLILVGEDDIPDVHAHAGAIESRIVGAKRIVVSDAGHLVSLERPEVFNELVLEFLALLPQRSAPAREPSSGAVGATPDTTAAAPAAVARNGRLQSGFAPVSGTALFYEMLGDGPPVVLLHGGLVDRRMWDDQFEALAQRFRVIRYDLRGYGLSKGPPTAYRETDDLRELLNHLGISRAHIVGLSLGGRIAIDFALQCPEMVRSLIPVGPGLGGHEFTDPAVKEQLAQTRAAFLEGNLERIVALFQDAWVAGPQRELTQVAPRVRERVQQMGMQSLRRGGMAPALPLTPPAIGRLKDIHAPTLLVAGEMDQPEILRIVDRLAGEVEGARTVVIPGAAHMVNMEQPARFNAIVSEFLSGQ